MNIILWERMHNITGFHEEELTQKKITINTKHTKQLKSIYKQIDKTIKNNYNGYIYEIYIYHNNLATTISLINYLIKNSISNITLLFSKDKYNISEIIKCINVYDSLNIDSLFLLQIQYIEEYIDDKDIEKIDIIYIYNKGVYKNEKCSVHRRSGFEKQQHHQSSYPANYVQF